MSPYLIHHHVDHSISSPCLSETSHSNSEKETWYLPPPSLPNFLISGYEYNSFRMIVLYFCGQIRVWANQEIVEIGGAWHAALHGFAKSQTWLSDWTTMTTSVGSSFVHKSLWFVLFFFLLISQSPPPFQSYLIQHLFPHPLQFSSVPSFSRVWLFATPWIAACQASLSITNSQSLPKLMSIEPVMPSSHLILCRTLLFQPPIFPSLRVFANESALRIRWPKYWSFSFNISLSSEHPGLISLRMDWLDLLAVQGTLKSLLQHHSSKASASVRSFQTFISFSHILHSILETVVTVQLLSWVQLCNPMDCRMPAFLALHHLLELTQTHVLWVSDAIQQSYPLSSPSSHPALSLSQHQDLFQWVGFSQKVAKVLELQLQHQSFQWIFRTDFL